MTIVLLLGARYFGLESDTKPTLGLNNLGAAFYETDTFLKFIWDGTQWGGVVLA